MNTLRRLNLNKLFAGLILVFGILYLAAPPPIASAAIPKYINFQGKLIDSDGNPVADGAYTVTFRFYSAETGGSVLWTEEQSVTVSYGVFNVALGTVTTLGLDFGTQYWLSVQVSGDTEMTPRQRLTSSGYAINADNLDTLTSRSFLRRNTAEDTVEGQITFNCTDTPIIVQPSSASDPNTKLIDVKNTGGTSKFSVDYEGDMITQDATVSSGMRIGTGSTPGDVTALADDSLFVEGAVEVDGAAYFDGAVDFDGNVDFTGVTVTGLTGGAGVTHSLDDAYDDGQTITVDDSGDLVFNLNSDEDFHVYDANSAAFTVTDEGLVGIGTTNPSSGIELDVAGDITASGTITAANFSGTGGGGSDITFTGTLDMGNSLIINIGDGGTDFTSGGGLNLASDLDVTGTLGIGGLATFTKIPTGTGVAQGSVYINPASATANNTLLGLAVNGTEKFRVDEDGDIFLAGAASGIEWSDYNDTFFKLNYASGSYDFYINDAPATLHYGGIFLAGAASGITWSDYSDTFFKLNYASGSYDFYINDAPATLYYGTANFGTNTITDGSMTGNWDFGSGNLATSGTLFINEVSEKSASYGIAFNNHITVNTGDAQGGIIAINDETTAISGTSINSNGVYGKSTNSNGVYGKSTGGYGVYGESTSYSAGYFYRDEAGISWPVLAVEQRHSGDTGDILSLMNYSGEVFSVSSAGDLTTTGTVSASAYNISDKQVTVPPSADADTDMNAAVSTLTGAGGKIILLEGLYQLDAVINLDDNIHIEGAGWGTILKIDSDVSSFNVFSIDQKSNCSISNLQIDGNKVAINDGTVDNAAVYISDSSDIKIYNNYIHHMSGDTPTQLGGEALYVDKDSTAPTRITFTNNLVTDMGDDGVDLNHATHSDFSHNIFKDTADNGIDTDGATYSHFDNNIFIDCLGWALELEDENTTATTRYCTANDNTIQVTANGSDGILIKSGSYNTIIGNTLGSTTKTGTTAIRTYKTNTGDASEFNIIANNTIKGWFEGIIEGVDEATDANDNLYMWNEVQDCTTAYDVNGANSLVAYRDSSGDAVFVGSGIKLDENENITLGSQTLDHDGTDFVFSDSGKFGGSGTSTIAQGLIVNNAGGGAADDDFVVETNTEPLAFVVDASGEDIEIKVLVSTHNIYPITDDTYYLGKNDDDTPFAWKGLALKDTTNGKYYRIEVINGTITATDLTD